ncbi:MAG: hypothetical protein LBR10_05065, partial [Prevotellaceae bacterium]|nr:hypothetical protein [Prevotellaceae bacterium]
MELQNVCNVANVSSSGNKGERIHHTYRYRSTVDCFIVHCSFLTMNNRNDDRAGTSYITIIHHTYRYRSPV